MSRFACLLAATVLFGQPAAVSAHEGSTSYLIATQGSDTLSARLDVALIDMALALPLDGDADGRLTWNEVQAGRDGTAAFLARNIRMTRGGEPCIANVDAPWLTDRLGMPYLSFDIRLACARGGAVGIASNAFFDADTSHRMLIALRSGDAVQVATLSPSSRAWAEPLARSRWATAADFIGQGMWHVWIGYDHLLFLLLLLLPAVTTRAAAEGRSRAIAIDLVRVVTAFTLAHSVTLALAATGTVRLPQGPIEAAIALSIVIAAGLNLAPRLTRVRMPLAFGFGLVHGFGFANALAGLDDGGAAWPALAGFNVGVELANLAAIAVALPVLLQASLRRWYAPRALPALSLAAATIGAAWFIDRI